MEPKEKKISVTVMRLLRIFPTSGSFTIRQIAKLYNGRYPAATKPRQLVNWLTRIPLVKYRLGILVKLGLVKVTPMQLNKRQSNFYGIAPKGEQCRLNH